jgi:hypothetical protein
MKAIARTLVVGIAVALVPGCESSGPAVSQVGAAVVTADPNAVTLSPVWSRAYWGIHLGEPFADVQKRYRTARTRDPIAERDGCERWRVDSEPSGCPLGSVFVQVWHGRVRAVGRLEEVPGMGAAAVFIERERTQYSVRNEMRDYDPPRIFLTTTLDGQPMYVSVSVSSLNDGSVYLHRDYLLVMPPPTPASPPAPPAPR